MFCYNRCLELLHIYCLVSPPTDMEKVQFEENNFRVITSTHQRYDIRIPTEQRGRFCAFYTITVIYYNTTQ